MEFLFQSAESQIGLVTITLAMAKEVIPTSIIGLYQIWTMKIVFCESGIVPVSFLFFDVFNSNT